jgi:hypothetical protein
MRYLFVLAVLCVVPSLAYGAGFTPTKFFSGHDPLKELKGIITKQGHDVDCEMNGLSGGAVTPPLPFLAGASKDAAKKAGVVFKGNKDGLHKIVESYKAMLKADMKNNGFEPSGYGSGGLKEPSFLWDELQYVHEGRRGFIRVLAIEAAGGNLIIDALMLEHPELP